MTESVKRIEYRVSWRREGWNTSQREERIFDNKDKMLRYCIGLRTGRPDLMPLTMLTVHQRPVGNWELVDRWVGEADDAHSHGRD